MDDLRYPWALFIIAVIVGFFIFLSRTSKKQPIYKGGKRIANAHIIKSSEYYQKKLRLFRTLNICMTIALIVAIACTSILIARPKKFKNDSPENYNRDIILCMDSSASVWELDSDIIDNLKKVVSSLQGERFGVSIFNTTSVTLVPLTTDYDYVLSTLDRIQESIKYNTDSQYGSDDEDWRAKTDYVVNGTIEGSETLGSSLIGEGLASCVYSFPKLEEEDRSRIVIFSTDNDNYAKGAPLALSDAAKIAKKKNVTIFGIVPEGTEPDDAEEMRAAIEGVGGKFYNGKTDNVEAIVSDVEKTSKSLQKNVDQSMEVDSPYLFYIPLIIAVAVMLILWWRLI